MSRVARLFRRPTTSDGRYNFSKTGGVVKIHLLDNTTIEFAVATSDSGQAVLEKVGKTLSLHELLFYGLKFRTSASYYRWVDREKSVCEQLKRSADRNYSDVLYFCVQYFIHDVNLLPDDTTRYLYYLQLKKHILSRRLLCGLDEATVLASYAIQAEFGDHDREVHTVDFLSDFDLIPGDVLADLDQEVVMRKVTDLHQKNHGLSPETSELCYVKQAQLLPTYGIEFFPAKDINSLGLLLGASYVGIIVRHANGLPPVSFRWADILNIRPKSGKHGGQLQIETPTEYIFFKMDSPETAHYVWQFFVQQHAFFRKVASMTSAMGSNAKPTRQEFSLDAPGTYENGHQSSRKVKRKLTISRIHGGKHRRDEVDGGQATLSGEARYMLEPGEGVNHETPMDITHLNVHGSTEMASAVPLSESRTSGASSSSTTAATPATETGSRDGKRHGNSALPPTPTTPVKHTTASDGGEYAVVSKRGKTDVVAAQSRSPTPVSTASSEEQPPPLLLRLDGSSSSESCQSSDNASAPTRASLDLTVSSEPQVGRRTRGLSSEEDRERRFSAAVVTSTGLWGSMLSGSSENLIDPAANSNAENKRDPPSISPSSPRSEQCNLLHSHMKDGNIYEEFEDIYRKKEGLSCQQARKKENAIRNRFRDIMPYDVNRVMLDKRNNFEHNDYINASHIKVDIGEHRLRYIATQGPLLMTCDDFWQMVWEQEVSIIAMVTMKVDNNREKCFAYWPDPDDEEGFEPEFNHGLHYRVKLLSRTIEGKAVISQIEASHLPSRKSRVVSHVQFQGWPDHGVPEETQDFLDYLHLIRQLRGSTSASPVLTRSSGSSSTSLPVSRAPAPVLVHCSAGIGRTGVTILLDVLITAFEENQTIDVPGALRNLRDQRAHFVQNAGQYKMIYETLIKYLSNDRLV